MSRSDDFVIVGAGQAGVQVACSLRDAGHLGAITLVGDEPVPPYQRPPLSKGFLTGAVEAAALAFRTPAFWAARGIDLVLGESVTDVVGAAGGTGQVVTAGGRVLRFNRLVLATGAVPRHLDVPGASADGVTALRTLTDAHWLRDRLPATRDLVVVGGGFIGLEVAATAAGLGCRVTVLEAGPRILGRAVSESTSRRLTEHHRAAGIEIRTGVAVTEVATDDGAVAAVATTEGTVPAQLVVVGVGAEPRTELAGSMGLHTDGGIVVDRYAVTSDGSTVAVGDCTVVADPTPWSGDGARVRLESVDHAVQLAGTAARTLLGDPVRHSSVPWFWSEQGKAKLQIAGLRRPGDDITVRPSGPGRHVVGFHRDGRLVAAEVLGSPGDFMALRTLLEAGHPVPVEIFADSDLPLRQLAKEVRGGSVTAR